MPYAVTCRSCGARFSIGDELYRKRFAGRVITLRCKQCQGPIRLNASETPSRPQQNKRPVPSPPAPPVRPRPPLRSIPEDFLDNPEQIVALSPGLMATTATDRVTLPQFSTHNYVDVTDSAKSEPSSSGVPPLDELAKTTRMTPGTPRDDTDFLLGLSATADPAAASPSPLLPALIFDDDALAQTPRRGQPPDAAVSDTPLFPSSAEPVGLAGNRIAGDDDIEDRVTIPNKRRISPVLWFGLLVCLVGIGAAIKLTKTTESSHYSSSVEAARPAALTEGARPAAEAAPAPEVSAQPSLAADTDAASATIAPVAKPVAPVPSPARVPRSEPVSQPQARGTELTPAEGDAGAGELPTEATFDKVAATNSLSEATTQASACRKPGDPSGMANVTVTFAPSGRVTSATVAGPPFAGTETGGCIASTLRNARVPAFTGDNVTVTKTVVIQ